MNHEAIQEIVVSAINTFRTQLGLTEIGSDAVTPSILLSELGLDVLSFADCMLDLEQRFDGRDLGLSAFMVPETFEMTTLGDVVVRIRNKVSPQGSSVNPIVVYVDDEEENLFVFRRKFGKDFTIKTFADPREALDFIAQAPDVALVITDEVMPGLRGNELCDQVKKVKPYMKFILITGNPEHDNGLLYKSLRHNRFFEFIQKPVDFDNKREIYLKMIRDIIDGTV